MRKLHLIAAAGAVATSMAIAPEANAVVTLCGVVDQTAPDQDPTVGIVRTTCVVGAGAGTGTFDGTAQEFQATNFDLIVMRGILTGFGTLTATNAYTMGPWVGIGGEKAFVRGTSVGADGGFIIAMANASTFSNNPALAAVVPVGTGAFADEDVRFGTFGGPGVLTAQLDWDARGGTLDLLHTGDFQLGVVPEPDAWTLMLLGFAGLGAALRRARRRLSAA